MGRLLVLLLSVWVASSVALGAEGWKAGAARVSITPTEPMWMAGYASRSRPAEGKAHDLWLRALALEDANGQRAVIVSADVVGISREIWDNVVAALDEELDREQLMFNSSHTHSGPVMGRTLGDIYPLDDLQKQRVAEYTKDFENKAVAVIREALKALAPATLSTGQGTATFGANRRNNPEGEITALREKGAVKGPSDSAVPVLAIKNSTGKLVALVFSYACHNTVLDSYVWSGDYAGFAQDALEAKNPGVVAMFVSGCGGDQNPLPRRELELAKKYGQELASSVEKVLSQPLTNVAAQLSTRLEFVTAHLGDAPTREELTELAKSQPGYQQRWGARLLAQMEEGKPFARTYAIPVEVWRLGDILWIAMGGEVVVDYSLKFKEKYGPSTWVTAYANDVMAYIPSLRVLKEGGYEGATSMVAYGMPAYRWGEDIEDLLTASVLRLVGDESSSSR